MNHPRLRQVAALTVVLGSLAACGGDDDAPPAAADVPSTDAPSSSTAPSAASDGPMSTVPPDIPEAFVGSIGPVDVLGEPLVELPRDPAAADPAAGTPVPVLVGLGFDGDPIRIDPASGGPTAVVFVAHWCPHCNAEIPVINELRDDGLIPAGLDVVAVSTAVDPGRPNFPPADWLADRGWTFPAMADGVDVQRQTFVAAEAYGVSGFPFVTLVDGEGNVAARWSGERTTDEWVAAIDSLGL